MFGNIRCTGINSKLSLDIGQLPVIIFCDPAIKKFSLQELM